MAIRSIWLSRGVLVAWAALLVGCASADAAREVELPPQTLTEAPTSTTEEERALATPHREPEVADAEPPAPAEVEEEVGEEAAPAEDAEAAAGRADERRQTVVIQSGSTTEVSPRTLYEASSDERRRRAGADAPVAVITNSNLAEQAAGGQLTVLGAPADGTAAAASPSGATGAAPVGAGGAVTTASPSSTVSGSGGANTATGTGAGAASATATAALTEEYWRGQALTIRLDWKAAVERVDELENEVQELRRRFYEEDDPFYRDNQIKPAWDRALDTLSAARTAAEEHERRLGRFLEEGRRSGALPGWLREGMEFEPPATPIDTPAARRREQDPWEPKVLEEEPRDP